MLWVWGGAICLSDQWQTRKSIWEFNDTSGKITHFSFKLRLQGKVHSLSSLLPCPICDVHNCSLTVCIHCEEKIRNRVYITYWYCKRFRNIYKCSVWIFLQYELVCHSNTNYCIISLVFPSKSIIQNKWHARHLFTLFTVLNSSILGKQTIKNLQWIKENEINARKRKAYVLQRLVLFSSKKN